MKKNIWNVRYFVPSAQRTIVLYCRLSDFYCPDTNTVVRDHIARDHHFNVVHTTVLLSTVLCHGKLGMHRCLLFDPL